MNPTAEQLAEAADDRAAAVARVRAAHPRISAREVHRRVDQANAARRGGAR